MGLKNLEFDEIKDEIRELVEKSGFREDREDKASKFLETKLRKLAFKICEEEE